MYWRLFWSLPLFSGTIWIATLLGLLLTWITDGSPHYSSMDADQKIAYISDVGAHNLKPLFVTGSILTVVTFDSVFVAERWLRHTGRLERNTSRKEKVYSILCMVFAIVGAAGLILLSIFDTARHPKLHDGFLSLFMVGYVLSAVFVCLEYWGLGRNVSERRILRVSFYTKLAFVVVVVAAAIAFGICQRIGKWNVSAVLEWIIALLFAFYVFSFVIDFLPSARSVHTHVHRHHHTEKPESDGVESA